MDWIRKHSLLTTTARHATELRSALRGYSIVWIVLAGNVVPGGSLSAEADQSSTSPNVIVVFTDDLGYADLGVQGQVGDVKTPHLDQLANEGVRCTAGYITAPQCSPSRAGLITGRYQQRYGIDTIPDCPLPLEAVTIAERLKAAGYVSGMVGKWHLHPNAVSWNWARANLQSPQKLPRGRVNIPLPQILKFYPRHQGFDEFFVGELQRYYTNFHQPPSAQPQTQPQPAGKQNKKQNAASVEPGAWWVDDARYRLDIQTEAALQFVQRNHQRPFFLYLCYYAPHVPLAATDELLARFPGDMPERRRYALAMISAMDDGVGQIKEALASCGIDQRTLIVFTSDNGAPLKMTKADTRPVTVSSADWDGSLNDPWVGEKGMLSEGGIRVPMLWHWPGTLPAGRVYSQPVISLDIAATAVAIAGVGEQAADPALNDQTLDGVNLVPYLTQQRTDAPHEALFWRFWNQAAVRAGDWKYLVLSDKTELLFDLSSPKHERRNLLSQHPEIRQRLRQQLEAWTNTLQPPGIPTGGPNNQEAAWYRHYFDVQ